MGLLLVPRKITPAALGILSRNAPSVVCFTDGSASVPAGNGGIGVVSKFGYYTVEIGRPITGAVSSDMAELLSIEAVLDLFPPERNLFIKCDCLAVIHMLIDGHQPKSKRFLKSLERVRDKIKTHNVTIEFLGRKHRTGTPHTRADRLATKARLENRGFFRIMSAV